MRALLRFRPRSSSPSTTAPRARHAVGGRDPVASPRPDRGCLRLGRFRASGRNPARRGPGAPVRHPASFRTLRANGDRGRQRGAVAGTCTPVDGIAREPGRRIPAGRAGRRGQDVQERPGGAQRPDAGHRRHPGGSTGLPRRSLRASAESRISAGAATGDIPAGRDAHLRHGRAGLRRSRERLESPDRWAGPARPACGRACGGGDAGRPCSRRSVGLATRRGRAALVAVGGCRGVHARHGHSFLRAAQRGGLAVAGGAFGVCRAAGGGDRVRRPRKRLLRRPRGDAARLPDTATLQGPSGRRDLPAELLDAGSRIAGPAQRHAHVRGPRERRGRTGPGDFLGGVDCARHAGRRVHVPMADGTLRLVAAATGPRRQVLPARQQASAPAPRRRITDTARTPRPPCPHRCDRA